MKKLISIFAAALMLCLPAVSGSANPYAVAIRVNDSVITNWEIDQRIALLRAFGTGGNLRKTAEEQLIEDRLRVQAARAAGIEITQEEIEAGVAEFAQRGNLTGPQLYAYVQQRGASKEALEDFVRAGLMWRALVQARFGPRAAVSEAEVDTALSLQAGRKAEEILIAEIRLPLDGRNDEATLELAERLSREIQSEAAFAAAARRYSRAPSRVRGGLLDWLPVASLPPQVAGPIMALNPGEVTAPIPLGPTVGLFQLRGVRPARNATNDGPVTLSWVSVEVPGDARSAEAAAVELINDVDTCLDLRAQARRFGREPAYTDRVEEEGAIPAPVALALANLDRNEATWIARATGGVTVLMLCERLPELPEGARDAIRNALFQQRIGGFGQGYLEELKGEAVVIRMQ